MKKIGVHPLFLAIGIFICLTGSAGAFFTYLFVVILHEFAHKIVASFFGYEMNKFFLMPYGAGISFKQNFLDEKDEIIIALAGPLFNFFLAFICIAVWWIFPSFYVLSEFFVWANLVTAFLNLLPAYPLDGGRILTSFLSSKMNNREKALKFCFVFNYVFSGIFLVIALVNIYEYYSFLIMAVFIFLGTFESKFSGVLSLKNLPLNKQPLIKNKVYGVNNFVVSGETEIYKITKHLKRKKSNIIFVKLKNSDIKILDDEDIYKVFTKFPINETFENILK